MSFHVIAGLIGLAHLAGKGPLHPKLPKKKRYRMRIGEADAPQAPEAPLSAEDEELQQDAEGIFELSMQAGFSKELSAAIALDSYRGQGGATPSVISAWQSAMGLVPTGSYSPETVELLEAAVTILETPDEKAAAPAGSPEGDKGGAPASGGGGGGGGASPAAAASEKFDNAAAALAEKKPKAFGGKGSNPSYAKSSTVRTKASSRPGPNSRPPARRPPPGRKFRR